LKFLCTFEARKENPQHNNSKMETFEFPLPT